MKTDNNEIKRKALLLLLASAIWGFAFAFQSKGGDACGPYTFCCLRYLIGFLVLLPLSLREKKKEVATTQPKDKRRLLMGGICCGLCLSFASLFQQMGMYLGTGAGKAGFLTSCYIVLVPVIGLFVGRKCGWNIWVAVAVAVGGLYLLCMKGSLTLQVSDTLVLCCSVCYAMQILVVDYFSVKVNPVRMSCIQFLVASVICGIPMLSRELLPIGVAEWSAALRSPDAWIPLLYAGVLSSGVAFTLQCIGQRGMNPTVASLLMSPESVFSVLGGMLILGQMLSARELAGCVVIFAAIIFAQLPLSAREKS